MAQGILVVGSSGSGKSTSIGQVESLGIKGVDAKETFIINVKGKSLPTKGWQSKYKSIDVTKPPVEGNYLATTDAGLIVKTLQYISSNRQDIKNVIIDDCQYIMSQEFMENALKTGFDKFNKMAKNMFDVINTGISMRHDINFIILTHDDEEDGKAKMKTLGKLLDDKVNLEGLFTIVLYTVTRTTPQGTTYHFATNRFVDDRNVMVPAKSPVGMFDEKLIPNDMGYVLEKVEEFNENV